MPAGCPEHRLEAREAAVVPRAGNLHEGAR